LGIEPLGAQAHPIEITTVVTAMLPTDDSDDEQLSATAVELYCGIAWAPTHVPPVLAHSEAHVSLGVTSPIDVPHAHWPGASQDASSAPEPPASAQLAAHDPQVSTEVRLTH
jgi:hypothetical protein